MKVTINNFRSYRKRTTFKFNYNTSTLITGESGTGKTTIFDAISWCLFGSYRKISDKGRANVIIDIENLEIKISRFTKPNILTVTYKGKDYIDSIGQQIINDIICNKTVWTTTSYLAQKSINPLLSSSSKEKLSIISKLSFNEDDPNDLLIKIAHKQKSIENELNLKINSLNSSKSFYKYALTKVEPYEEELELRNKIITKYKRVEKYIENNRDKYAKNIKDYDRYISIKNSLEDVSNINIEKYKCLLNIQDLNNKLSKLKIQYQESRDYLSKYENVLDNYKDIIYSYNETKKFESLNRDKYYEQVSLKSRIESIKNIDNSLSKYDLTRYKILLYISTIDNNILSMIFDLDTNEYIEDIDIDYLNNLYNEYIKLDNSIKLLEQLHKDISKYDIDSLNKYSESLYNDIYNYNTIKQNIIKLGNITEEFRNKVNTYFKELQIYKKACADLNIVYDKNIIQKELDNLMNIRDLLKEKDNSIDISTIYHKLHMINLKSLECPKCNIQLYLDSDKLIMSNYRNIENESYLKRQEFIHKNTMNKDIENINNRIKILNSIRYINEQKVLLSLNRINEYDNLVAKLPNIDIDKCNSKYKEVKEKINEYNIILSKIHNISNSMSIDSMKSKCKKYLDTYTNIIKKSINKFNITPDDLKYQYTEHEYDDIKTKYQLNMKIKNEIKDLNFDQDFIDKYESCIKSINKDENYVKELYNIDKHKDIVTKYRQIESNINTMIDKYSITEKDLDKKYSLDEYVYLSNKVNNNKKLLDELNTLNFDNDFIEKYEYFDNYLKDRLQKVNDLKEIDKYITIINEYEDLYDEYEDIKKNLEKHIKLYDISAKLLSEYLASTVLTIQTLTNEYLSKIFDDSVVFRLKLDKTNKTSKHTIPSKVNISMIIRDIEHENINSLSGGELDRLSFCITLALNKFTNSKFLLLDETMSAISSDMRNKCNKILKWEFRKGRFIMLINHDDIEGRYDYTIKL